MTHVEKQVPDQQIGGETNTEYSYAADSKESAVSKYERVKKRMLDINHWQDYAGSATASFELRDDQGHATNELPKEGFYFRIDIPGPGSTTGKGYDWVRVERIDEEGDSGADFQAITMRVRPSDNPNSKKQDTAHFYSKEATSNFMVKREGNKVTALVLGRNEKPNTGTSNLIDKARNVAVGATAAAGLSVIQWNLLVKGLIRESE